MGRGRRLGDPWRCEGSRSATRLLESLLFSAGRGRISGLTADPSTPEGARLVRSQNVSPPSFFRLSSLPFCFDPPELALPRRSVFTSPWTFLSSPVFLYRVWSRLQHPARLASLRPQSLSLFYSLAHSPGTSLGPPIWGQTREDEVREWTPGSGVGSVCEPCFEWD